MQELVNQLTQSVALLKNNFAFVASIVGILYGIQLCNFLVGYRLNILGIWPRKFFGLFGIIFSPFLHSSFNHIFFNSIPLFILISFILLTGGVTTLIIVSALIILIGGLGTWLIGRPGVHIGASGVIMGYWSYLLIQAYKHPSALTIALGIVCVFYLGGLASGLVPARDRSSWEAHLSGFIAGILTFYICNWLIPVYATF